MDRQHHAATARSLLFVPADRPDRYAKAVASGADLAILDLEDAVVADNKEAARGLALEFVATTPAALRINALASACGAADLLALGSSRARPAMVFMPKVETAPELTIAHGILGSEAVPLVAMIETPEGLANAFSIASSPHCTAVLFGGADFAAAIQAEMDWDALFLARMTLVHACARAGKPLFDSPSLQVTDQAFVSREAGRVRAIGFHGKAAIHPAQVAWINQAFAPTPEQIAEARAGIAAFADSGGSAILFNGRLIDEPVAQSFARVLSQAGASHA